MQGISLDELKEKLCANEGPKVQATQPDFVKFHDDKVTASDVHQFFPKDSHMSLNFFCRCSLAAS